MTAAVVRASAGNPLALRELTRTAASGEVTRQDPLLPMSEQLERAFAAELPGLPAGTRRLLVLAAAGADDLGSLTAVGGAVDVLAGLEPAERSGLLRVGAGRITWRHPLARAATYAAATAGSAAARTAPSRPCRPSPPIAERGTSLAPRSLRRRASPPSSRPRPCAPVNGVASSRRAWRWSVRPS